MELQITLLARLATIDTQLDELHDDLGDLPVEVKKHEQAVRERTLIVERTLQSIKDLEALRGNSHVQHQELTDREQRLTDQQFQVKNNREFDAITKEIEHAKAERAQLDDALRTASVKEENLKATLEQQQRDLDEARALLQGKEKELELVSGENNDDLKKFITMRRDLVSRIEPGIETEYERIRTFHREAAVPLRRGSCSGCYSAIPSQRVMEMKYNREKIYTCENCGRILFPEDLTVDIDELVTN